MFSQSAMMHVERASRLEFLWRHQYVAHPAPRSPVRLKRYRREPQAVSAWFLHLFGQAIVVMISDEFGLGDYECKPWHAH